VFLQEDRETRIEESNLTQMNGTVRALVPKRIVRRMSKAMNMDAERFMQLPVLVVYHDRKIVITIGD
jgi:hypothetical protein